MWLGEARAPDGMRLYAIGDVHGCDGLLAEAHAAIAADLADRPVSDHRIIHLGDYVDRGDRCREVIERLASFRAADPRVICLRGNHDDLMADFLADPAAHGAIWLANGGLTTLLSYGVAPRRRIIVGREFERLGDELARALPEAHRAFLLSLPLSVQLGDFFFCHAGIRPGVPLDRQADEDLMWIRAPFLENSGDFGVVVVHGHTPVDEPVLRRNRIGIDTGAVFDGRLTTLAVEGAACRFLQP